MILLLQDEVRHDDRKDVDCESAFVLLADSSCRRTITLADSSVRKTATGRRMAPTSNHALLALDQINKDNFGKLEVAWRFKADALGPRPEYNWESRRSKPTA